MDYCSSYELPLWDNYSMWATSEPVVSPAFEHAILLTPCCYLWIFASLDLFYYVKKSNSRCVCFQENRFFLCKLILRIRSLYDLQFISQNGQCQQCANWINRLKLVFLDFLVVCCIIEVMGEICFSFICSADFINKILYILSPSFQLISFVLAYHLVCLNTSAGLRSSWVLFIFWLLCVSCGAVHIWELSRHLFQIKPILRLLHLIKYPFMVISLALNFFAEPSKPQPKNCPEKTSSFPSKMTFAWVTPLVKKSLFKTLENEDLWTLDPENKMESINKKFERKREKEGYSLGEKFNDNRFHNTIFWPLARAFGRTFLVAAFLRLLSDVMKFLQPFVVVKMYEFVGRGTFGWHGYLYVELLVTFFILKNVIEQQQDYHIKMVDHRVQSALYSAVFKKVLKVTQSFHHTTQSGDIMNVLAVDINQLVSLSFHINNVWPAPIQIIVVFCILWSIFGKAMVAGVVVTIIISCVSLIVSSVIGCLQAKLNKVKDKRYKLTREVLLGIKIVKLNGWEESFEHKFRNIRRVETRFLKIQFFLESFSDFVWQAGSVAVMYASLYYFIHYMHTSIDSYAVMKAYMYFNYLQMSFIQLPYAFKAYSESKSSMKRISDFFNADEVSKEQVTSEVSEGLSVEIKDGTFTWRKLSQSGKPPICVLHNINLTVKRGSLVAVVGTVGSGKSSLLAACLRELETIGGSIKAQNSVAYVPQQAWIRNGTVKNNILLDSEANDKWYKKVLNACALVQDLSILPEGDETIVGDQGMTLSGGQKHRISLARAVYFCRDLYLLDDTLSAFDVNVGRHIFEQVIGPHGLLKEKNKTRILVTQSLIYLTEVDEIVFLEKGEIVEKGTFDELMSKKKAFYEFVSGSNQQKNTVDELMSGFKNYETTLQDRMESTPFITEANDIIDLDSEDYISDTKSFLDSDDRMYKTGSGNCTSVYSDYFKRYWGLILVILIVLMTYQFLQIASIIKLGGWGEDTQNGKPHVNVTYNLSIETGLDGKEGLSRPVDLSTLNLTKIGPGNITEHNENTTGNNMKHCDDQCEDNLISSLLYVSRLDLASAVLALIGVMVVRCRFLSIGISSHKQMMRAVLAAPLSFLDSTPIGQAITRFTHDIYVIDYSLPLQVYYFLLYFMGVAAHFWMMVDQYPFLAYFYIPIFVIYIMLMCSYLKTNRELRRLEVASLSPINSLLTESYQGTSSIRGYNLQQKFESDFNSKVESNQQLNYHFTIVTMWLNFWLDFLGIMVLMIACLYAVYNRENKNIGGLFNIDIKMIIIFASHIPYWFMLSVKAASEISTDLVSFERIKEYQNLQPEENKHFTKTNKKVGKRGGETKKHNQTDTRNGEWPRSGKLVIKDLSVKYPGKNNYVLQNINFSVKPGQKIGIVGRTGAGKSSLALAIFGVLKPATDNSKIYIDDIDISKIPLKDLRSNLSIIPQDPVLFTDTLRMNLDPLKSKNDDDIWKALKNVPDLERFVRYHDEKLNYKITDGGSNLSVGLKQLICLVRALLRKSKILVLDEATSSMDMKTDKLVHETIKREFQDSTLLIIAHRLNTVLDADKVLVIENGKIVEDGPPHKLMKEQHSIFYKMARNADLIKEDS